MFFENQILEYDLLELHDGREVVVMEVLEDSELAYRCEDIGLIRAGDDFADGIVFTVKPDEIKRVVEWGHYHEYGGEPTKREPEEAGELKQFSYVELINGRRVVILDIIERLSGIFYDVEDLHVQFLSHLDDEYFSMSIFVVEPFQVKRVIYS